MEDERDTQQWRKIATLNAMFEWVVPVDRPGSVCASMEVIV